MSDLNAHLNSQSRGFFRRYQTWILLGLLGINVIIYGAVWWLSRDSGSVDNAQPGPVAAGEGLELRSAYQEALAVALNWQPDAQLVGATTSWQLGSGDVLTLHRSTWAFQFYSPGAQRMHTVTVNPDGAQAGRQQSVKVAPRQVTPDWDLDSDALLLTFLGHGGQGFFDAHPSANFHLSLKGTESGRAVWHITAIDPVARQSFVVQVDARSRQVLSSDNAGGG